MIWHFHCVKLIKLPCQAIFFTHDKFLQRLSFPFRQLVRIYVLTQPSKLTHSTMNFFCDLSVLVRKLACVFGHPTQVSAQIQLRTTCESVWPGHYRRAVGLVSYMYIFLKVKFWVDICTLATAVVTGVGDLYEGVCFLQVNPFRAISGLLLSFRILHYIPWKK